MTSGLTGSAPRQSTRTIQALIAGVAGLAFVGLIFSQVDAARVGAMLHAIQPAYIVLGVLAFCVDFVLRAARFWMMLRFATGRALSFRPSIGPYIASFGISDILPFRAGDAFRVYWFNRRFAIPLGRLIGAMIVERLLDLVSIVMLGVGFVVGSGAALSAAFSGGGQIILVLMLFAGAALLFCPALITGLLKRVLRDPTSRAYRATVGLVGSITEAISLMGSLRRVAGLLVSSLILWMIESLVFLCAWLSLGGEMGAWLKPGLAFAAATLGTLVPALPGHFGSFDYFGVNAFMMAGVDATRAAAVTFTAHLVLWAPTALFAIGWLLFGVGRRRAVPAVLSGQ